MSESLNGCTSSVSHSEIAAQRLLLAALQGGVIKPLSFSSNDEDAKKLAEFLGALRPNSQRS